MQAELHDCCFFELYCSGCNSKFRIVLESESATSAACPECGVEASLEIVGHGKTTRELPFSQFLHRGRFLYDDNMLFYGTPRQRRMKFRASLPADQQALCGTH